MKRLALISAMALGLLAGPASADVLTQATYPINISTATTTVVVAASAVRPTLITAFNVIVGGADNVTLEYGFGPACGGNTTLLSGAYPLAANGGIAQGTGAGAVIIVPIGYSFCVVTSAAVQASGFVSVQQ